VRTSGPKISKVRKLEHVRCPLDTGMEAQLGRPFGKFPYHTKFSFFWCKVANEGLQLRKIRRGGEALRSLAYAKICGVVKHACPGQVV